MNVLLATLHATLEHCLFAGRAIRERAWAEVQRLLAGPNAAPDAPDVDAALSANANVVIFQAGHHPNRVNALDFVPASHRPATEALTSLGHELVAAAPAQPLSFDTDGPTHFPNGAIVYGGSAIVHSDRSFFNDVHTNGSLLDPVQIAGACAGWDPTRAGTQRYTGRDGLRDGELFRPADARPTQRSASAALPHHTHPVHTPPPPTPPTAQATWTRPSTCPTSPTRR
jgi:hypothetical protein